MEQATTMPADTKESFGVLLEQHRGIVLKVARTYAYDADDRADLAQEIAAQLWRAYPRYDPERTFSTWMYRIALNVAISFVRGDGRRERQSVPLDDELHDLAGDGVDHEKEQQIRALRRFIAQLPPLDRALMLLYLEDRSGREIAEVLGISESNVTTKLGRMKQRIRNEI
ncbi:MAG TPA: sigma-70 family RNA polymerase sigma factor [Luteimonas sp.]|nr:sigma-70 family RNA polymerase sigma factor [Luteimonas sp.]